MTVAMERVDALTTLIADRLARFDAERAHAEHLLQLKKQEQITPWAAALMGAGIDDAVLAALDARFDAEQTGESWQPYLACWQHCARGDFLYRVGADLTVHRASNQPLIARMIVTTDEGDIGGRVVYTDDMPLDAVLDQLLLVMGLIARGDLDVSPVSLAALETGEIVVIDDLDSFVNPGDCT